MNNICPFCRTEVAKIENLRFDLRICPGCLATFFPTNKTMSFRNDIFTLTRKKWLAVLESRGARENVVAEVRCIDHGELLEDGKLPDYGIPGKVTTCCGMFHLTADMTKEILQRSLVNADLKKEGKHHFAFIRALDGLINKLTGNVEPEEDPIEAIQYELHFKHVLEK